ncbi:MAG: hypothetical protein V4510_00575 [bacterium]
MQRAAVLVFALVWLAGCAHDAPVGPTPPPPVVQCGDETPSAHRYYLGPGMGLNETTPSAGAAPGNGFNEAFLTNDLTTWLSQPVVSGLHIEGNVTLDLWVQVDGQVAPPDQSSKGDAYTFLNQFGSDRAFQSGYAKEAAPAAMVAGLAHLNETLRMPAGGFIVEKGDRLRLLITSLVMDTPQGKGTHVLYGGATPSRVTFLARCSPPVEWQIQRYLRQPVVVPASQGGPAHLGGVDCLSTVTEPQCINRYDFPFSLENGTQRLRIHLRTASADRVPKSDMDMRLLDTTGKVVYDASTPFANETMVLWADNLAAFAPPGAYVLEADLYGGANYSGLLEVTMEHPVGDEA